MGDEPIRMGRGRLFVGAPGADPTDLSTWDEVAVETTTLRFFPDAARGERDDLAFSPGRSWWNLGNVALETADVNPDLLGTLYSQQAPRHTVEIRYREPDVPAHPVKRPWLRGRRYRAACRAHSRAVRRWKRAGRPQVERMIYLPSAQIEVNP